MKIRPALASALLLTTFTYPVGAQSTSTGPTVNCGSADHLQKVIDAAPVGSTINVSGTCSAGPYVVTKSLTLRGTGPTSTLSTTGDRVLDIIGANVRVEGLTIDARNASSGILIEEGSSGIIDSVTVRNSSGAGIQAILASYAGITRSALEQNVYGVLVDGSSSAWMDDNVLDRNSYAAVAVSMSSSAFIYNNRFTNGHIGVLVERLSSARISGNHIDAHTGPGVLVSSRNSMLTLGRNTIQSNGPDVRCDVRGFLIVEATQTSTSGTTAIDPGCVIEGGPLF